ncbi:hypothetical protein B7P43_G18085 [Cryptotermes secundus]|uniref:Uncharacterized protein n=1 Tax=Cryptotermes secundus TaxID=105785 RepID=A0A2J7PMC0_9NEOP|nr:hypothetical protein B7P43_G18085 [Cryptotermes secundus]
MDCTENNTSKNSLLPRSRDYQVLSGSDRGIRRLMRAIYEVCHRDGLRCHKSYQVS